MFFTSTPFIFVVDFPFIDKKLIQITLFFMKYIVKEVSLQSN